MLARFPSYTAAITKTPPGGGCSARLYPKVVCHEDGEYAHSRGTVSTYGQRKLTAEEATQRRRYASRNGFAMPISQYERDLYAARARNRPSSKVRIN